MTEWLTEEDLFALATAMSVDVDPVCDFLRCADAKRLFAQACEANRLREGLENLKSILDGQIESGDVYPRILRHHVRELLEGEK